MKFKKLLALFLAVLMLASTFVLTASAEGTDEKKGLAWELNYFSFIPVYQENQDINADKPTLLMSGRGINNLAFLRDADQYLCSMKTIRIGKVSIYILTSDGKPSAIK